MNQLKIVLLQLEIFTRNPLHFKRRQYNSKWFSFLTTTCKKFYVDFVLKSLLNVITMSISRKQIEVHCTCNIFIYVEKIFVAFSFTYKKITIQFHTIYRLRHSTGCSFIFFLLSGRFHCSFIIISLWCTLLSFLFLSFFPYSILFLFRLKASPELITNCPHSCCLFLGLYLALGVFMGFFFFGWRWLLIFFICHFFGH